ncbi:Transmembrane domain-containing protein [Spironucleus salmonicida]|uniref:Transmembrane domain-containing protein n=1 Tax=Spironucleus salmonicida TaxID=348837 RepID=A0A9P8LQM5_9EUKA|nr:Transmembrane domain-containing protein [Spironucleus salmonicida]
MIQKKLQKLERTGRSYCYLQYNFEKEIMFKTQPKTQTQNIKKIIYQIRLVQVILFIKIYQPQTALDIDNNFLLIHSLLLFLQYVLQQLDMLEINRLFLFLDSRIRFYESVYILTIFSIVQIPTFFRPVINLLVKIEQHVSYSQFQKPRIIKYYIFTILNKLSILYYRRFSELLELDVNNIYDNFKSYFGIFSIEQTWRNGSNTVDLDLLLIIVSYAIGYNLVLWLIFNISCLFASENKGIVVHTTQVYISNLIVFTLIQRYALQQSQIIHAGILYYTLNYFFVKYYKLNYAQILPKTRQLYKIIDFIVILISIGSFIAIIQYNFNYMPINCFGNAVGHIAFSCIVKQIILKRIENKSEQAHNKQSTLFRNMCFESQYELPQQLDDYYQVNMNVLIKQLNSVLNSNQQLNVSVRGLAWSQSENNFDYSLQQRGLQSYQVINDNLTSFSQIEISEMILFDFDIKTVIQ